MSLKSRFESREALIDAIRAQKIIQGDERAAEAIVAEGELVEFTAGQDLIVQGDSGRDVFFLVAGRVHVVVNGMRLFPREKNSTVGEMSAINPQILRSATIRADETTVAWRVSHQQLDKAGEIYPRLWKLLAMDISGRLEQRNQLINRPNAKPRLFIICSAEALDIAEHIRLGLEHEVAVTEIWSDEHIFPPSGYPLDALEKQVNETDIGIAIAQPDELVRSRHKQTMTPRDNVIFELGFFMSRLGRQRTLLLVPRGEALSLPSDFKGMTPINYKNPSEGEKVATALGPAVTRIKEVVRALGVRRDMLK